ncbi:MAG: helix-hairpin-helix domain-containing protein [Planctomycetota bacterium]
MINDKCFFQTWWLTTRELAVWIVVIGAICIWLIVARYQHEVAIAVYSVDMIVQRVSDARIASWRLDLNDATANDLVMLPGIGAHRAQMILRERKKRGAFQSIWELSEAPGFTKALLRRLEPLLRVSSSAL